MVRLTGTRQTKLRRWDSFGQPRKCWAGRPTGRDRRGRRESRPAAVNRASATELNQRRSASSARVPRLAQGVEPGGQDDPEVY